VRTTVKKQSMGKGLYYLGKKKKDGVRTPIKGNGNWRCKGDQAPMYAEPKKKIQMECSTGKKQKKLLPPKSNPEKNLFCQITKKKDQW